MGESSKPISNFSGGEASPSLYGRTDVVPYFACAKKLENVLVTHFGSAVKTPGTKFVARTKASGVVKLIPFIFSTGDSYILEFGNLYMRVFRNGGSVVETAINISGITKANPAVVTLSGTSPSNGSYVDIESVGGMTQVNNKRFIVANRTSNTFELQNEDGTNINSSAYTTYTSGGTIEKVYELTTTYATADLGNLRVTQQADIMYIDCAGYEPRKLSRLGNTNWTIATYAYDQYSWPPFLDGNITATTVTPAATTGTGVNLTASTAIWVASLVGSYIKIKTGYVKVTGYTSTTVLVVTVMSTLADTSATTDWAYGAWSEVQGYPSDCKFYENRLYHVATTLRPLDMWGSVISEYENYQTGTGTAGAVTDEDAVNYQIGSNQVDKINWIYPTQILNFGTAGGPFTASSGSASEPITPTNISVTQQNENGSANIVPVRIGAFVYYIERSGKVLGQFSYSLTTDSYDTENITYLADHILGDGVVEMALQRYPYNILWCALSDGTMATLTREQKNDVKAWTRQTLTEVKRVAVIPNGVEDQVWIVVKRTINSVTRYYIEYFMPHNFGALTNAFFVQSGLTYSGTAVTTVSGLDHLEGRSVKILVDGASHPARTVSSGSITLDSSASVIHVGLGYSPYIRTLDIEAGSRTGTAMAKPKYLGKVHVRLKDSVGCSVGTAASQDPIPFRSTSDDMDEATPMFSGDIEVVFPQGWTKEKEIVISQTEALPLSVLAIYPKLNVSD
jgi:hypothetical protein